MFKKAIAICNSYGFRGSYWEKGQIVELEVEEKIPEHFKLLDGKEVKEAIVREPTTLAQVAQEDLINEAIDRGVKDAKILTQNELLEVLAKDTTKKRIEEIIKDAKGRNSKKKK